LFSDVQGDQCLDGACYGIKVEAHIDRELAARPELVQIENGYRNPKEKRPGAVQLGHVRVIEHTDNPDAEPETPCDAAKTAIIVYGKRVGTTLTVCTDNNCPIHDPRAAAHMAEHPEPVMPPAPPAETEEEAEARRQQHEQQRKEYYAEQERRAEENRLQEEREEQEFEAAQARRDEQRKARAATFERILENAPETLSAAQLRVLLRAIVNLDPYTFTDDLAEELAEEVVEDNEPRSAEELLLATIEATADNKLTRFAIRLAFSGHVGIPRENETDFLSEAATVFAPTQRTKAKTRNTPVAIPTPKPQQRKQKTAKKQIAA
jgi:ParB family chromosome partitioning protein